ncbi:U2 small nuclear ribonucleoprotein auxiliary factor 35 kDa subunit-related protein 2 [Diorhabda carinulata]|uniref:U2 small nuclear ribonucleoprotein auxiliary factor 35 kDa subunit-related protein 2 n=1 Tax=Diorhabda carinulata TaxID=1163345 RepID=UPI0025A05FE4|nr:U2 small nuclear ribonucleoprotein auxiliary factor 35 kDa subunit-related protein 2 [Diorhabda carinulata]XP_057653411.1 U2 small nuclear ribonucleoprotein auxiliary factor 35 kDa subunit-related protein 2 [Diorhabda carinulata]
MGKHSEWRKLAKKYRRKRIRQQKARVREENELLELKKLLSSPSYQLLLAEKNEAEKQQKFEEDKLQQEKEREWLRIEEEAQKQFQELQKKLAIAREERAKQNEKIILEWKEEQKRRDEQKKQEEEKLQQQIKQQELLNIKVEEFLEYGGDTPEHLKTTWETNPNKPLCPFFQKTSTCRFFDVCSRNHVRPGISSTILIPNFFSHYSLEKTENEHLTDSNLEFEKHETQDFYREFYNDVVPEIEKYGKIELFITCCNHEAHLRGNVFVKFCSTHAALKCFRALNGRWYGGKQLSVQFCNVPNWKSAVCGVHFSNRCPKGNSCNFLHPFRNPRNAYSSFAKIRESEYKKRNRSESTNWRWSESPEPSVQSDWEKDSDTSAQRQKNSRNGMKRKRSKSRSKSKEKSRKSSSSKHSRNGSRSSGRSRNSERFYTHRHK